MRLIKIENLTKFLRKNNVKKIVEIPDYFNKKFINKKDCTGDVFLTEIKYDDLIKKSHLLRDFQKKYT